LVYRNRDRSNHASGFLLPESIANKHGISSFWVRACISLILISGVNEIIETDGVILQLILISFLR